MRILVVSPVLPYPPTWGFATRVYQIVRLLVRNHPVTLLSYAAPHEMNQVAALRSLGIDVHTVPRQVNAREKRLGQLLSLGSRRSYQWRSYYSDSMQRALTGLTDRVPFDVIQIESSQLACLEFDRRAALVVDEHNIEFELLYRTFLTEESWLRRGYNWTEFRKFKREEVDAWQRAAGVVTTSAREAVFINDMLPGKMTRCVPNAVDVDYFHPTTESPDPNAIVLTGLMKYRPNVDAALYFVRDVMPRILAVRPKLVFSIVGGDPPDEVKQLAGPNVVVTGTVPDVRPYVRKAAVVVVPLRMGSGTRLKVLEGLAMEKAMVSTALGCEGIDVEDGQHLLVASDAASFAGAVIRLLNDRACAEGLGRAGRVLVDQRYRWERVVADLEDFHRQLLAKSAGSTESTVTGSRGERLARVRHHTPGQ